MRDPREVIAESPMGSLQILVVAITVALNALDGFDVLAISFASPGIAVEWGIDRAALGIVLSMELIGMALGSVLLGGAADRIGRRPTILLCLVVMTTGMLAAAFARNVIVLSAIRLVTGLGIGGMLAAINAMAAEFANARRRNLAVSIMAAGYPLGVIAGGSIASMLLATHDWRSVFLFGAVMTGLLLVPVWFALPESIGWLMLKRPPNALERINATLRRMGHAAVDGLPQPVARAARTGAAELFEPALARTTLLLTCAYFAHV